MVANVRGYTPNHNFKLINFDTPRWHTLEYSNWNMLDAILVGSGVSPIRGEWTNSTIYTAGDRAFDPESGSIWRALVTHTSAANGTFEDDRLAHPTYWVLQDTDTPIFRGEWVPSVSYMSGDIVYYTPYAYYLCVRSHTASVDFNADQPLYWQLVMDGTAAVDTVINYANQAGSSANSAAASANDAAQSAIDAQVHEVDWKGAWDGGTAYMRNDAVQQGGSSYISNVDNNTGNMPPHASWDLMAAKGSDATGPGTGDMLGSVNLAQAPGGVGNTVTARANLGLGNSATRNVGTATGTVAAGDDSRLLSVPLLQNDVAALQTDKAALASPIFTGDPRAPTPSAADNDTSIATTAFVQGLLALLAPKANPVFTGDPQAPTAATTDNDTSIATTAFVRAAIAMFGAGSPSNAIPLQDGVGNAGTASPYSREDHVHPTDTTRAPVASPTFTGDPKAPTPAVDDTDTSIATTAFVIGQASTAFYPLPAVDAVIGTSKKYAREDHVHPTTFKNANGTFNQNGSADLNTYVNAGYFTINGAINGPSDITSGWVYLRVQQYNPATTLYLVQNIETLTDAVNKKYYRICQNNGWSPWMRVVDSSMYATVADYLNGTLGVANKVLTPNTVWNAAMYGTPSDSSGTITPNFDANINHFVSLTGVGRTLANPSGTLRSGQAGVFYIQQDGAGNRTITSWGTFYKFPGGIKPTISPGVGALDTIAYQVINSSFIVCNWTGAYA